MEEKRKDLKNEKQKKVLQRLVDQLSRELPDLYYMPTSQVAFELLKEIQQGQKLDHSEKELLEGLSAHDIQILLSLH